MQSPDVRMVTETKQTVEINAATAPLKAVDVAHDQRLDDLEVLGGLNPGNVNDTTTASLIRNVGSETHTELSAAIADMSPILQTKFEMFGVVADVGEEQVFWGKLASQSPRVRVETIGASVQGRPIRMISIGDPVPPSTPASLDANSLLIVATQQGGEPAPREAVMQLGRNLALSDDPEIRVYLRKHPIYLIPTLSPDGETNGTYENANGVNINRDHLALAEPETRAFHEVVKKIKPHLILDMHESGVQATDFMVVAGRYLGAHPGINQITSELYVQTTKAVKAIGRTVGEYGGSSQEPRALHIMGQLGICPVSVFESHSTGRPIEARVLEQLTGANTLIEYHRVNAAKVRAAVLALRSGPPEMAYLQHSNQVSPAPTGYRLTSAQWAVVQSAVGVHGLQALTDGTDRIVTLDQWKGWIVPNLFDSTATWPIGTGTRMATPISDYVVPDNRTDFPPVPKTYVKIFGEDTEGQAPTGVTSMLSGTQTVTAVPGARNGKALAFSGSPSAVAITAALNDPLRGDSEILFRWKANPFTGAHGPSAFLRMSGGSVSPSGYRGGYRHVASPVPATGGAQLVKYTSGSAAVLGINTRIPLYESEQWYYTRFRMQADLMTLTIWKEGEETPLLDQNQIIDGSYVNGWAGVGTDGAISFFVDWIVHATGGARAVAPN